jgi:hypothetical protein
VKQVSVTVKLHYPKIKVKDKTVREKVQRAWLESSFVGIVRIELKDRIKDKTVKEKSVCRADIDTKA